MGAAASFKRAMSAMHAADEFHDSPVDVLLCDQMPGLNDIVQAKPNSKSANGQDRASLGECGKFVYM